MSIFVLLTACGAGPPPAESVALFNGRDLSGWHVDVPAADDNPQVAPSFLVRDGMLVSRGSPPGHLITDARYADYRLVVEYRWPGEPGNCGVLVHASVPRRLYGMFPQSIECQMHHGNAGDLYLTCTCLALGLHLACTWLVVGLHLACRWLVDGL